MAKPRVGAVNVQVRVVVIDPVPGCAYAVQRGKAALDQVQIAGDADLVFTVSVELGHASDGSTDARGEHVQGPRGGRFVYVNSGTLAGQAGSAWTRRAKIPLRGLLALFEARGPGGLPGAEVRIAGRARDQGPACATVPLLGDGWS